MHFRWVDSLLEPLDFWVLEIFLEYINDYSKNYRKVDVYLEIFLYQYVNLEKTRLGRVERAIHQPTKTSKKILFDEFSVGPCFPFGPLDC